MNIFDTHCHYNFPQYTTILSEILEQDHKAGVKQYIQIGTTPKEWQNVLDLCTAHHMHAGLAVHPCYVKEIENIPESLTYLEQLLQKNQHIKAIGETGLDLYREKGQELLKTQTESLEGHLFLCKKYNLPVIFHIRGAWNEFLDFTKTIPNEKYRGVVHCFTENPKIAQKMVQKGFHLGIGGLLLHPANTDLQQTVKEMPLTCMITETDAPFLVPHTRKKETKLNRSAFIVDIIQKIAEIKALPTEKVADQLYLNAKMLFQV